MVAAVKEEGALDACAPVRRRRRSSSRAPSEHTFSEELVSTLMNGTTEAEVRGAISALRNGRR